MNILESFLQSEINTQELYEEIISFITSYHIRCGEFEGNEYIIKKMDQINFLYSQNIYILIMKDKYMEQYRSIDLI